MREVQSESESEEMPRPKSNPRRARRLAGHQWHVMASSTIYALLYSVALLIEVAYQFDRFSLIVWKITPLIFLWIFGTSVLALNVCGHRTRGEKSSGLLFSVLIFTGASVLLYAALGMVLP